MDLGLAALGTKMYQGQPVPRTELHAEYDYFNADYGLLCPILADYDLHLGRADLTPLTLTYIFYIKGSLDC